ncbi:hypothetical protein FGO68_gene15664 [Halteria grandinella]|uniref:Nucleotidyl transferase domain-containing protein n=1 Tax=Halteria grandinella TaxID=5974 RepID=A0A8J8NPE4_HALGN|nr:hypothetical protein FGO68_gene15664 [Halteria grandinella]
MAINAVIIIGWEPPSTRFRPFSISLPPPLFPIGGYPLIFHHIKALSNLSADLKNVFLMGSYDEKKFRPFLDYARTMFNFKIHYLQEEIPNNSAGALFFFKEQIQVDQPKFLFVMHCDICSSFPLHEMLKAHQSRQDKEATLLTVMCVNQPSRAARSEGFGRFIYDPKTWQVLHFTDHAPTFSPNQATSCGIYLYTVAQLYTEPSYTDFSDKYARILSISKDDHQERSLAKYFNEFANQFKINTCTEQISMRDLLAPMSESRGRAHIYVIDQQKHFWHQIQKTKQLLSAQDTYLKYYQQVDRHILTQPSSIIPEDQIVGLVCIHPTAEVHPGARIGPNVTIGAHARVADGARIINSIILEDCVVQPHAVVINSIIGWSSVIGSWTRVEGLLNKSDSTSPRNATTKMMLGASDDQSTMTQQLLEGEGDMEGFYHSITGKPTCQEIYRVLKNGVTTIGGGVFIEPELHLRNVVVLPFKRVNESSYHQIIV